MLNTDRLITEFDTALRAVFARPVSLRSIPGANLTENSMSALEKAHAAALMRVNHVGEICAQALYQGQGWVARDAQVRTALAQAAIEEAEHLAWTEQRIRELGGRKSLLNPLWYLGALSIGVLAGRLGDGWNLGFLAETERQVEAHLDSHLDKLPEQDVRSRAIVDQMKADELSHAEMAVGLGARMLPEPAKSAMRLVAKVMTGMAYYV